MNTFWGYERSDGSVGIRNHVAVIPSVACANGVVMSIARQVPGAVPLLHGHGCGRAGRDLEIHMRTLTNLGKHPNVAAVLVVGLGCEVIRAEFLANAIAECGKTVEFFNIQEAGGSQKAAEKGAAIARRLLADADAIPKKAFPLERLILGLQCGGSDAFSGVTANAAVGKVSDWLVDRGGTVILTENTEMIGTLNILKSRACSEEVAAAVDDMITGAEKLTRELLGPLASIVIAPGNMDGGMSSIREKSLGCIIKGGSSPVRQVVDYAEIPSSPGLILMDAPGYDTESIAGVAAAGAQLIIFTTGRGNPLGFPVVPVIKVASTSRLYRAMEDDMDIDAGVVLDGKDLDFVAQQIIANVEQVLNGKLTKAEKNQQDGLLCLYTTHASF